MNKKVDKVKSKVKQSKFAKKLTNWYMRASLPGFEGVPLRKVVILFVEELQKDKIGPRAAAISFNFMLALFPALIFIFSLIPVIPVVGLQEEIFELLQSILPDQAFQLFRSTIEDTISQKRVDWLSTGFVLMIIFATNGMNAILKTFAKINPAFKNRGFFKEYGVALLLTILISGLILTSLILIIFGSTIIQTLLDSLNIQSSITFYILLGLKWFLIAFIYFLAISILYYFAPALYTKWKFISLGSTVATVMSIIASVGFSYYVNNFGQYNKLYGSLGTFIVVMLWININSLVLIFGFELNNSIRLYQMEEEEEQERMLEEEEELDD